MESNLLEIFSGTPKEEFYDRSFISSYKWDNFQINSFINIQKNKNILVVAPTSSGKTAVAKYAIIHNIKNRNKKVMYSSPIKSLSNEKFNEFRNIFKSEGITVGLLTGDNKINVESDVLVVTTEIIRNYLVRSTSSNNDSITDNIMKSVGCVIMDEIHFINTERGKVWEETIILLDPTIQLVMLSATIDKPEKFASWITSIKSVPISLIKEDKRIIPLTYNIFINKELHDITKLTKIPYSGPVTCNIKTILEFMKKKDLFNAIFFSFSKKKCEQYASHIDVEVVDLNFGIETGHIFDNKIGVYRHMFEKNPRYIELRNLIIKGIAYHHAGLPVILKEIVEILFKDGRIKVLFATETFAVGINSPVRTVVFMELEKYNGCNNNMRFLLPAEFKQMSGRAGRRGQDTEGYVIIPLFNNNYILSDIKDLIDKPPQQLFSDIEIDYQSYINLYENINIHIDKTMVNNANTNKLETLLNEKERLSKLLENIDKTILDNFRQIQMLNEHNIVNIKIKLSKDQEKKQKQLNKIRTTHKEEYEIFRRLDKIESEMETISNHKTNTLSKIHYFLTRHKYIIDNKLTKKAVLISCINECNPFILTELFINNYFDDKTSIEIVQILSLFCDEIKTEQNPVFITDKIKLSINFIEKLISDFSKTENENYWKITKTYIDISFEWASGKPTGYILNMLSEVDEYEGNFIKNMIKIINIANTLKTLCKLWNKLELITRLDQIDILLKKDIVNNGSLYIQ
jgi:superfamily II RNA helicase